MSAKAWWNSLCTRWANWVGDRDQELAIRSHLNSKGFRGDSAEICQTRLAAVQRPGWLQVYLFHVNASSRLSDVECQLFGVMRQDERYNKAEVRVFGSRAEQMQLFREWSEGLSTLRRL